MTITEFGRVELDIKAVPAPARGQSRESIEFERSLEQADRSHDTERVDSRNPSPQPSEQESSGRRQERAKVGSTPGDTRSQAVENVDNPLPNQASVDSLRQTHTQEEGPAWRNAAGKGSGPSSASTSPFPSSSSSSSSSLGHTEGHTQAARQVSEPGSTLQPTLAPGEQAGNQAPSSQPSQVRVGIEGIQEARVTARTSRTAAAGYRSFSAQALQLAEQARDSVFKQIALKITPEGGKMLLLLDPPELGQLDIRMIVEKGNVVRLSIGAERPEVAMMLEKHMPELKSLLGMQGLSVADAEVHTHDFQGQQALEDGEPKRRHEASQGHSELLEELNPMDPALLREAGFITADGLDFWV